MDRVRLEGLPVLEQTIQDVGVEEHLQDVKGLDPFRDPSLRSPHHFASNSSRTWPSVRFK
jgi:hypothetical protein